MTRTGPSSERRSTRRQSVSGCPCIGQGGRVLAGCRDGLPHDGTALGAQGAHDGCRGYARLETLMPPGIDRQSDSPEDCAAINRILGACMAMDPNHRCTVAEAGRMLGDLASPSGAAAGKTVSIPPATTPTMVPPTEMPPRSRLRSWPSRSPVMTSQTQLDTSAEDGPITSPPGRRRLLLSSSRPSCSLQDPPSAHSRLHPSTSMVCPAAGVAEGVSDGGISQLAQRAARSARSDMRVAYPEAKGGRWRSKPSWTRTGQSDGLVQSAECPGLVCRVGNGRAPR